MPIYNKIVRDRIPEIIIKAGKEPITSVLTNEEYIKMLDKKLNEECAEYQADKNIEELADILEVIFAITKARGYSLDELEGIRAEKADKRGGFEQKIFLKEVID